MYQSVEVCQYEVRFGRFGCSSRRIVAKVFCFNFIFDSSLFLVPHSPFCVGL